ncbi:MAG: hypothetical protein ACRCWQ_09130 [Bacilli bacterium]
MRQSESASSVRTNPVFDISYHSFLERDAEQATAFEMASEFGLTYGEVYKLRRALQRRRFEE